MTSHATPKSPTSDDSSPSPEAHEHRLRHLLSVQIRNFTPFPVRDEVTSSLSAVGPPPLDFVDDMELTLGRRRSRRISTNSLGTIKSLRTSFEHNRTDSSSPSQNSGTFSGRPRANSRSIRKNAPVAGSGYPQRPARERAASSASSISLAKLGINRPRTSLSNEDVSPPTSPVLVLPEESDLQADLEQVVSSRLVETFLSLEVWPREREEWRGSNEAIHQAKPSGPQSISTPRSAVMKMEEVGARLRSGSNSSRISSPRGASFRSSTPSKAGGTSSGSTPSSPNQPRFNALRQSPKTRRIEPLSPTSIYTAPGHALPTPAPSPPPDSGSSPPPFYISAFHRPSTNPCFASMDTRHDFAPWVDLGEHRFRVFLWGHGGSEWGKKGDSKETGSAQNPLHLVMGDELKETSYTNWEVLASWDVDMDDLVPLSAEYLADPTLLSPNTLVVRLAPDGGFYYLPGGQRNATDALQPSSRAPSPTAGYSDTEVSYSATGTMRRTRRRSSIPLRAEVFGKSLRETKMKKSAGFGEVLKLVSLQSAIADTRMELDEIIEGCDALLDATPAALLLREISQKQETLQSRNEEYRNMSTGIASRKLRIEEKRAHLTGRRNALDAARKALEKEQASLRDLRELSSTKSQKHAALVSSIGPVRTTLLQSVSNIFPIEPLEPRDLLFTILDVPLPIPMGNNDPAPPLTLASDSSYNDETMASALGFVAQVVTLVTGYLGDIPMYPIVCKGSRSMIKDPISAMMGPRMFPLYARGIDTYRFEYGVFLLNKNIELLMGDHNVYALDLRHTLPNLKNLLLTLTSGESAALKPRKRRKASTLRSVATPITPNPSGSFITSEPSTSGSSSPSHAPSDSEQSSTGEGVSSTTQIESKLPTTPTASKIVLEPDEMSEGGKSDDATGGGGGGATTTVEPSASTIRKSFYSPLASFLRARYPTVRTTPNAPTPVAIPKVEVETPSPPAAERENEGNPLEVAVGGGEDQGDADETSTIRGSIKGKSRRWFGSGDSETTPASQE